MFDSVLIVPLSIAGAKQEKVVAQTEVAPEFKSPLQSCTADEGSVAILECAVVGTPMPQVRWLKDDKPVVEDKSVKIESLPDGTQRLTIKQAKEEDIGEYKCEAVNPVGKVSCEAPLKVNSKFRLVFASNNSCVNIITFCCDSALPA